MATKRALACSEFQRQLAFDQFAETDFARRSDLTPTARALTELKAASRWQLNLDSTRRGNEMGADLEHSKTSLPAGPRQTQRQHDYESAGSAKRVTRGSECEAMFARLQEIVLDGLRHGFFDCVITCELVNAGKRRVVIKAGKSHQFTIREEDLCD